MPIHSMTAFGVGENCQEDYSYRCEVKSLNARFLDINVRLPRGLGALEREIMQVCKASLKRGKLDINFDLSVVKVSSQLPSVDQAAVLHYKAQTERLSQLLGQKIVPLSAYELLRLEGVLESHQQGQSGDELVKLHREGFLQSLKAALSQLIQVREVEGRALGEALRELVQAIGQDRQEIVSQRDELQSQIYQQYRKRLENLLKSLSDAGHKVSQQIPEDRLLTELAILTDKSDIDEELTRLAAHEQEFLTSLDQDGEVGRKLDFLCQEMHREVNTMSNKLTHTSVAKHTLGIRQAVERIRQQVQNIE